MIDYEFQRAALMTENWVTPALMKTCTSCKYHTRNALFDVCSLFEITSPVDGKSHYRMCSILRDDGSDCGPAAVFWEAKDAPQEKA